jgi:hypothetical protein
MRTAAAEADRGTAVTDDPNEAPGPAPIASSAAPNSASAGWGAVLGSILKGLEPTVRKVLRPRSTAATGTKLALRYHSGSTNSWTTTNAAYGRRGNRVAVISSGDATWWHHVRSGGAVQVRVRGRWVDGHARVLSRDEDTYARAVGIFVEDRSAAAARRLGVPMDENGRLIRGERRPGEAVVVWIEVAGS